jgi:hypothetical protein
MRYPAIRLGLLGLIAAVAAFGQSQGTIQGVVTDDSGAVIPGAQVVVKNDATGVAVSRSTNEVGFYSAPGLNPGSYSVTASSEGFSTAQRTNISLEVAQTLRLDIQLNVGQLTETVEVSATAQLIQSEKTEVGQVIDSKRILEMPLNGRNYLELAKFSVGVLPSRSLGKGTRQDGERGGEGGVLAVGMHAAQTNVLVDGADNSSRNSGGALGFQAQATKPSVDAVGEFKVVTNNTSAEFGYRMGAKVIVSTKSGTNQLHGSAYEFLRNQLLDGTNFFANRSGAEKPTLRRNQYGATLGGPLVKNKMFAFFSWQTTRERLGQSFISTVPSAEALSGNFSNQQDPNRKIYDPLTLTGKGSKAIRDPFPNFTVPSSRFDPVAENVKALYPAPNIGGRDNLPNNFFFSPSDTIDSNQYDIRWDYVVTDAHSTFIRYSIRDEDVLQNGPLPLPANGGTGQTVDLPGQNWAAAFNSTLGPTKFNELRFGYTHFPTRFDIPFTENLNPQLGIKGAPGDSLGDGLDHGMSLFNIGGFRSVGPRGFWPNVNKLDNLQLSDNFTWIRGKHTLKFGGEYRRTDVPRYPSRHRRGNFTFNGVYTAEKPNVGASRNATGAGLADFLMGWANNQQWGVPNGEETLVPYWGFFIQDDYKVTNRLTLNLGLRYEIFSPPMFPSAENQTVSRLLTEINGRPFDPNEGRGAADPWGEAEYLQYVQTPSDGRDCGCELDLNNFAPRLGLAYRATDRTVVRVGAGLFYGEADNVQSESARFYTGSPLANETSNPQSREMTEIYLKEGFPPFDPIGFPRSGLSMTTTADGAWPQFYSGQWFVDVQQELGFDTLLTVGYNGSAASQLPSSININRPLTPDPVTRWQDRTIRPFFNSVTLRGTQFNNQNYHSLTVKGEKRFTKGFTFLSSFTWSHNIDVGNENLFQGTTSQQLFTYRQDLDRGNASLDRRLAYVASFVYELPFGKGKSHLSSGPGSWILGGWQVGGILSLLAGTPDGHSTTDTTNVGGANRGDTLRDPNLPASERTIDRWFDTTAVVPGQEGQLDQAGRNLIVGPPTRGFDFSLSRRFVMPWEGHSVQFRFESFNFTNTPVFGRPNTGFNSASAGTINQADEPRRIQFGLKYVF